MLLDLVRADEGQSGLFQRAGRCEIACADSSAGCHQRTIRPKHDLLRRCGHERGWKLRNEFVSSCCTAVGRVSSGLKPSVDTASSLTRFTANVHIVQIQHCEVVVDGTVLKEFARPITLVGGGKMGLALARGWLKAGLDPTSLLVVDPNLSVDLRQLEQRFPIRTSKQYVQIGHAVVVLAVKPQMASGVAAGIAGLLSQENTLLSIMAGMTTVRLRQMFKLAGPIVRAMPNLPASIGKGATAIFIEHGASKTTGREITTLLSTSGLVETLPTEAMMDAATAISGSGPAYYFLFTELLAEAGRAAGLTDETAGRLARATLEGAGFLANHDPRAVADLRKDVTSPAGTTAAALEVMVEEDQLRDVVVKAVKAAARRSLELSRSA